VEEAMAIKKLVLLFMLFGMAILFIPSNKVAAADIIVLEKPNWFSYVADPDFFPIYVMQTGLIYIPINSVELTFNIPNTEYVVEFNSLYTSRFYIYFRDSNIPVTFDIADYNPNIYGDTVVDLDFIAVDNNKTVRDITAIRIDVAQSYDETPVGYVASFKSAFTIEVVTWADVVFFYSQLQLYQQIFYYETFTLPTSPTAPTGYEFVGWRTINNTRFDINTVRPEDYDENGYLYLYAEFVKIYNPGGTIQEPEVNAPDGITQILTAFGLGSSKGYIFLYVIIILALTVVLLKLGVGMFATMIANLAVTALFMFLGYLPIFATIILIMIFVLAFMLSLKGGMANE
jgi:hypothetical protein